MKTPDTLRMECVRLIGQCISANYHEGGYGYDYRFWVCGNKGLYVTKWSYAMVHSIGYPDNWEVYELNFTDDNDELGTVGKKLDSDLDEAGIVLLAMKMKEENS